MGKMASSLLSAGTKHVRCEALLLKVHRGEQQWFFRMRGEMHVQIRKANEICCSTDGSRHKERVERT